ncbi:MAG TPA: prenyltransferase/squalene oxidase repeat-containing protein [Pirellulaceae bacterium]|nr:prenyltransferase/squalene oxidase repeat-containing protein [Pirellulaceae bacterium]
MNPFNVSRRQFNGWALSAGCGLMASIPRDAAAIQDDRKSSPNEKSPAELITSEARRAIDRALEYLSNRQIKSGRNRGAFGTTGYAGGVAACGLGGLAMMCSGSAPGQGRYGRQIDMCVEFVLNCTSKEGYITRQDQSVYENMYGHGFATLFLSQAYGMTQKPEIGDKLRLAVQLINKCQNPQGGWRYQPAPTDADLSVTVCQIMALRGARDAGIDVPDKVREKCIDYVKKSQNADGSFRYTMQGGGSSFAMTAAGITSLYSAGIYDGPQIEKGLAYLKLNRRSSAHHYFYSHYYAVQAMWHAGGDFWNEWYPAIRDELVNSQSSDGSWANSEAGPEFGAAMAGIILQMPLNHVPVFSP